MVVMEAMMKLRLMFVVMIFEVGSPQRHVGRRSHDELSV